MFATINIVIILTTILLSTTETKICNPYHLRHSIYFFSEKENFQYYPWHTYQPPEGKVKFMQVRGPQNIPEICKEITDTYLNIQEVILYKINLEYIEPGFFHSRHIEQVYIQYNKLKKIPVGVFNGTKIRSLVLSDNKIESIENGAFNDMKYLQAIALDYNNLKVFKPYWFDGAKVLYEISFTHNQLVALPNETTRNMVESLETMYTIYGSIYFDNNNIQFIHPDAFANLRNFGTISLSNNQILELSDMIFKRFEFLLTLYMNTNSFICFNDKTMNSFTGVKRLFLGNNKFNKECIQKLQAVFDRKNDLVYF